MSRYPKVQVGDVYGMLTVVERAGSNPKNGQSRWLVRCVCGVEKTTDAWPLRNKATKSCGLCGKLASNSTSWKGYERISGTTWSAIQRQATMRGISFLMTIEQAWWLFEKQERCCALTGMALTMYPTLKRTASLDRIDSNGLYRLGNVQWVHKDINWMKNRFSQDYFIEMCKRVAVHGGCEVVYT